MLKPIQKLVRYTSSSRGAKVTLIAWLAVVLLISFLAPSAKDYEGNSTEGSVKGDTASEIAANISLEDFPTDEGLTALVVFHKEGDITEANREHITEFSEWLASDDKPEHVASALPYHQFPESVQDDMFSEDGSTLIFNLALAEGIDSGQSHDTLDQLREEMEAIGLDDMQMEITGPAGISADTISLFRNADVVLILSTVALIFIILILIYRSPLLAITPLIIAAIVYGVVDRVLGLVGKFDIFVVESQAVSIMLVLMFAVLTDYSLFIFSRYREELKKNASKYDAMGEAIHHVSEPIFFSGGTVFLAMLTLFVTVFEPYNHFAPVFSIAVVFILLAGLTLIPAIFALMGRKAFWPFIPKVEKESKQKKNGFWSSVGNLVVKRPAVIAGTILIVLLIGAFNVTSMNFSFNLLKSFPDDMSSRTGFELLEENYPPGQLAPVTVILRSDEAIEVDQEFLENAQTLTGLFEEQAGVTSVSPGITDDMINADEDLPRDFLSENKQAIKLQLILDGNPYEPNALNTVESLRNSADDFIEDSGFSVSDFDLHYDGQTAQQLDVKQMNKRDMILLFSLVTIFLTIVLGFQTRSVLLPVLMMGTILLSYVASLGFGWLIFKHFFGYDAISYRLPVYTFVFMVALGIDYNIMLVSRIRENVREGMVWKEAVGQGVALTGGVISSAGLILAATFSVLMTQPLQELFLFGFVMAMGILFDTFIIRGFFLPSILILTHKKKA